MTHMTPLMKHSNNTDRVRAVIYVRQSKRREDDSAASPEAQREKCAALIAAKGWDLAGVFPDVGRSGWDPKVQRPGFDEMMAAVRAGQVDAVVVFALSRLTRQGAMEAMRIEEELRRHGVLLVSVSEPFLDTSSPIGVAIFGLIAALAKQESDMKSAYVTATKEGIRKAGGHTSGPAPYGFQSERVQRGKLSVMRLVPDPVEADHVRRMVDAALAGESAASIARRLNIDEVPTKAASAEKLAARRKRALSAPSKAPAWTSTTVLRILRDPRLAGFAIEWTGRKEGSRGKREILRDDTGAPLAAHQGIVDPEVWWRLQAVLDGRTPTQKRAARAVPTLLGGMGLLFCGVCGSVMVADKRNGKRLYRCNRASAGLVPGHGGLAINMAKTDDVVSRDVWSRLEALDPADPDDLEILSEAARRFAAQQDSGERDAELAAARAELEHVRAALRTLYEDRQDGLYEGPTGREAFREAVTRLTAHEERTAERVAALEAEGQDVVAIPSDWAVTDGDPLGPDSTWAGWTLDERRAFIALFVDRVDIMPSVGRGARANTEDRVKITWAKVPEA